MIIKKRFIPQLADITPSKEDFATLLASVSTFDIKEGTVVKGQVVEVTNDIIVVDVGSEPPLEREYLKKYWQYFAIGHVRVINFCVRIILAH